VVWLVMRGQVRDKGKCALCGIDVQALYLQAKRACRGLR
jgi:hypothetical protein